jgi:hypothetical protein
LAALLLAVHWEARQAATKLCAMLPSQAASVTRRTKRFRPQADITRLQVKLA